MVDLFAGVLDYWPDGNLDGVTDLDLESTAGWHGVKGRLTAGLVRVGWLDGEAGQRVLHNWDLYAESYKRAKIQKKYRKKKHESGAPVTSQPEGCYPTVTRRREEKRGEREEEEEEAAAGRSDSRFSPHPHEVVSSSSSVSVETEECQNGPEIATRPGKPWASGPLATLEDLRDWQRARQWGSAGPRQVALGKGLLVERPITPPERAEVERQTEREGTPTLGLAISIVNRLRTQAETNLERKRRGLAPVGAESRVNQPSAAEEAERIETCRPLTDEEREASMSAMQECIESQRDRWAAGQ